MAHNDFIYQPALITDGSNESEIISIKGCTLMGFIFPIGFEGTTITLKAWLKRDLYAGFGGPWSVCDPTTGAAVTVYTGGSGGTFIPVTPADLTALQYFSIVSASVATDDREILVVARPAA